MGRKPGSKNKPKIQNDKPKPTEAIQTENNPQQVVSQ